MLKVDGVSFSAAGRDLVHDATFSASPGEIVAIVGPNGAGKSTLLRIASGELRPGTGNVSYFGEDLGSAAPGWLAARRSVVPQATHLAFPFRVGEVVRLGASVPAFATTNADTAHIVEAVMADVDVLHLADRLYVTLSGGERQRTHLARALCQLRAAPVDPCRQLLFLDEPTASLDLAHQLSLFAVLKRLSVAGLSVVIVLHDLNLAIAFADKMVMLARGEIVAQGRPHDVMTDETLSNVFGCHIRTRPTLTDLPCVLPQFCTLG